MQYNNNKLQEDTEQITDIREVGTLEEEQNNPVDELQEKIQDIESGLLPGQVSKPWLKGGVSPSIGKTVSTRPIKLTNRQQREKEMLLLLRKIKPTVSEAIYTAVKIMRNEEASHNNQLKAATILLDNYRKLMLDLNQMEEENTEYIEEQDTPEVEDNSPVFSLKVLGDSSDDNQGDSYV